jgi:hypothetical protein
MSTASEPEQPQFCPRFSEGLLCRKKTCPFVHKWAVFNAAKREKKKLMKLKGHNMDSQSGSLAHGQDTNVVQLPWADEGKHQHSVREKHKQPYTGRHQQPHSDTPSSKFPRRPLAKGAYERGPNVHPAKPINDALKSLKDMEALTISGYEHKSKWAKFRKPGRNCVGVPGPIIIEEDENSNTKNHVPGDIQEHCSMTARYVLRIPL